MATASGENETVDEFLGQQGDPRDGTAEASDGSGNPGSQQWTDAQWQEWNSWWDHWPWRATHYVGPRESSGDSTAAEAAQDPWDRQDPWSRWEQPTSWGSAIWWKQPSLKPDYSDPPSWAGWSYYRLWKKSIGRWNKSTDIPTWKRSEKLLRTLDWELQSKFEHISDEEMQSPGYLDVFFNILDTIAGEKEYTDMRRAVRAALYEGCRKGDESLSQYSLRRESQFAQASKYLSLPENLKGFMLEEQSGLTKQGLQSLRVLTGGSGEYDAVRKALKVMDVEEEQMCKGKVSSSYFLEDPIASKEQDFLVDDDTHEPEDLLDTDATEDVFFAIQHMNLDEDEALSFVADWQKRKRSWSENKELKNAMKKDRRHFDDDHQRAPRDPAPPHRRRKNINELKRITRCANCGAKGQWKAECDKPYKPRQDRTKNVNAVSYLGLQN